MTIGNHEFDFGPACSPTSSTPSTAMPFLSANLDFSATRTFCAPLVEDGEHRSQHGRRGRRSRVGIIGATTEDLRCHRPGPGRRHQRGPARRFRPRSRARADGVDIIILSSHLQDLDIERAIIGDLSASTPSSAGRCGGPARRLPAHRAPTRTAFDVPLVTTPGSYRDVGKLVLQFDAAGDLLAIGDDSALLAVPPYGPQDERILTDVEVPVAAALEELADPRSPTTRCRSTRGPPRVRTRETNIATCSPTACCAASQDNAADFGVPIADVALQNGGGIRGDAIMTEDELSALFTFNTAPFGNRIATDDDHGRQAARAHRARLGAAAWVAGQFGQGRCRVHLRRFSLAGSRVTDTCAR